MEGGKEQLKLEDYIVGDSLPTLFYIPNFITESEQTQLLHHIYEVPSSKWKSLKNRRLQNWGCGVVHEKGLLPQDLPHWLTKITQRICNKTGLFPSPINHVLINEYLPNQGIMPHQDGPAYFPVVAIISLGAPVVIDFRPHPRLKESSEEQSRSEDSKTDNNEVTKLDDSSSKLMPTCSVLLKPRSLLIFKDAAYSDYLHGIEDSDVHRIHKAADSVEVHGMNSSSASKETDRSIFEENECNLLHRTSTRVSLTCRLVLKVHKNLFKF